MASSIPKLKETIETKKKSLILKLMNEEKCKTLVDFIQVQQGLLAYKKLLRELGELSEEE